MPMMPKRDAISGRIMPSPPRFSPPPPVRSSKLSLPGPSNRMAALPNVFRLQCFTCVTVANEAVARDRMRRQVEEWMLLEGKCALVTGSTSGIGLAIARAFAAEGAAVMINGFGDADEIEAIRAELEQTSGAKALHDAADLTKADAIEAMVARCAAELGGPDILVNNAGMQ